MIDVINYKSEVLAILIKNSYSSEGIKFFTPDSFSQQLAYMNRPAGYKIEAHTHNIAPREVQYTNEVLFIKSGKLRVDFFDQQQNYLESRILEKGDVILLTQGGHGFEMLEPTEIIEVKQGPYAGENDKTRFKPAEFVIKLPYGDKNDSGK